MDYAHALSLAKRAGLGMSGALNGAIAAAFLGYAGISLFDAVGTAAALMIFGWTGGFTGVTVASSQLAGRERERLRSSGDPSEVLELRGNVRRQCNGVHRGVAPSCPARRPQFWERLQSASGGCSVSRCRSRPVRWRACARSNRDRIGSSTNVRPGVNDVWAANVNKIGKLTAVRAGDAAAADSHAPTWVSGERARCGQRFRAPSETALRRLK